MNATINIPGSLTAKIENGRITGYVFMIAANDAGYFGPAFRQLEGDEVTDEQMSDLISDTLTISQDNQSGFMIVELGA